MAIVHKTFRRAFEESAQLVLADPTPSAQRVTFLANHIDFVIGVLHHHHESEDSLLYPLLAERAKDQLAMTDEVGHQHVEVNGAIDAVTQSCAAWRSAPSADTGGLLGPPASFLNTSGSSFSCLSCVQWSSSFIVRSCGLDPQPAPR